MTISLGIIVFTLIMIDLNLSNIHSALSRIADELKKQRR